MLFLSLVGILLSYAVTVSEIYLVPSANDFSKALISTGFEWNITVWVKDIPAANATFATKLGFRLTHQSSRLSDHGFQTGRKRGSILD